MTAGSRRMGGARDENPLVPHTVLRAMYRSMVEARLLEQHLGGAARGRQLASIRGQEACRAAVVQSMKPGDLVSDPSTSAAADLMLGVPLLKVTNLQHASPARRASALPLAPQRLPREDETRSQLETALGAAHTLKLDRAQRTLFAFCAAGPDARLWRETLGRAGRRELPIIFLLLPTRDRARPGAMPQGVLSDRARGWGVPGIPVDGTDGIAIYRVLSEATLRTRAGDGPTLIEAVTWRLPGRQAQRLPDPLDTMALSLVARRVASTRWQAHIAQRFRRRLVVSDRAGSRA